MSSLTTLAQNIVFTAWDWPKTVVAKTGSGSLREALGNKRFVSALLDCAYLGLEAPWSRSVNPAVEPITNFIGPVLLRVDQVIQNASVASLPIHIEELEGQAQLLRLEAPHFKVDPELVDAVTQFAREFALKLPAPVRESAGAVPA